MKFYSIRNRKFLVCSAIFAMLFTMANVNDPPNGRTGAPGDGLCTDCHSGGNPNIDGLVSILGIPEVIDASITYIMNVEVTKTSGNPEFGGFQVVALNQDGENAGDFMQPSEDSKLTLSGGKEYWEHNPAKEFGGGPDVGWQVQWEPPSNMEGQVITFYAAGLLANGNGNTTGDVVVTFELSGTMESSLGVDLLDLRDETCFGENDGEISVEGTGGSPPYMYEWSNGGNTSLITDLAPGDYDLTITDDEGIMFDTTFTVAGPSAISAEIFNIISVSCFGDEDGSAEVEGFGGMPGYTYEWSNGETGSIAENLAGGSGSVIITDSDECSHEEFFVIPEPDELMGLVLSEENVSCYGLGNGMAEVGGQGGTEPYIFDWSGGRTGAAQSDLEPGIYEITLTDLNECSTTFSLTIDEPEVLLIDNLEFTDPECFNDNNGTAVVGVSGGTLEYSYMWSNGENEQMVNNLGGGITGVTITDANGCIVDTSFTLMEPEELIGSLVFSEDVSCFGEEDGMAEVQAEGGVEPYVYNWGGGITGPIQNELAPGVYQVQIRDFNDCKRTVTVTINEPDSLIIVLVEQVNNVCGDRADGSIEIELLNGQGDLNFEWSNGDNTNVADSLLNGEYSVTVTDENNCSATAYFEIMGSEPLQLELNDIIETAPNANDGMIDLEVSGGNPQYEYHWSNGEITEDIENLEPGLYVVTVTDELGCIKVDSVYLNPFDCQMEIELVVDEEILCSSDSNGALCVIVNDNIGEVTYTWSDGSSESCLSGLLAGEYSVTVVDEDGCVETATHILSEPAPLLIEAIIQDNECFGDSSGQIDVMVSGGVGPYEISPDTILSNLPNGDYTIQVRDFNGCLQEITVAVGSPDSLTIIIDEIVDVHGVGNNGAAYVTIEGGGDPFMYEWTDSLGNVISNEQDLIDVMSGEYTLTVNDAFGCSISTTVFIDAFTSIFSKEELNFLIFPNPTREGILFLEVDYNLVEIQAQVYSSNGRLLSQSPLRLTDRRASIKLDLPPGLYILNLSGDGYHGVRSFIVGE